MATRFYMQATGSAAVSPSFDAGWEQTGQAVRLPLINKLDVSALTTLTNSTAITVPITTTQDILCAQFISDPIPPQTYTTDNTVSFIVRAVESAATANVTLALVVKIVSPDGGTSRGTLFSTFNTDTEFATTAATRIVNAQALTSVTSQMGDRLVIEVGGHAAGPTAGTTYTMRFGSSAATDFALTSALTTDLNPWLEISQDVYSEFLFNNYQFIEVGDGMSASERAR